MRYIGIDISKSTFVVANSSEKGTKTKTYKNNASGINEFMKTLSKDNDHCVLEATGSYSLMLVYMLCKNGYTVSMENPSQIKNFAKTMMFTVKTDQVDARIISLYGEKINPAPYKLRSDELLVLHQRRTLLRVLKQKLVDLKNLRESFNPLPIKDNFSKNIMANVLDNLEKQIKKLEESISSIANEVYAHQMSLLTSVKGIGETLASALIVATGGFTFFDNAKQFTRFVGLSPTYKQSGTSVHNNGHINRNGDSNLRSLIYMCAVASLRSNTECKACQTRLVENGKSKKLANIAVANKLIRQAFAVVMNDTPYIDGFISEKKTASKTLTVSGLEKI